MENETKADWSKLQMMVKDEGDFTSLLWLYDGESLPTFCGTSQKDIKKAVAEWKSRGVNVTNDLGMPL